MNWDYSYANFQLHGPDHPDQVAFEAVFPSKAYYVELPSGLLPEVINQNSVSLNPETIMGDICLSKWKRLKLHLLGGQSVAPPWGRCGNDGLLVIAQGKHRFQWAIYHGEAIVPVVVNHADACRLSAAFGVAVRQMHP